MRIVDAGALYHRNPNEDSYMVLSLPQQIMFLLLFLLIVYGFLVAFWNTVQIISFFFNVGVSVFILYKFFVSISGKRLKQTPNESFNGLDDISDNEYPSYTILVPVYQESTIIKSLLDSLLSIDYPPGKLEILILAEEDDRETIESIIAVQPPSIVTLVIIPASLPRTKPKALNVGLFLAIGEYLVIYDAEDRPEPDQLKKAVTAFRNGSSNLACVQASVDYFNSNENFLTRMFALEYRTWFQQFLPGLSKLQLPIPLAGNSNHFRTAALQKLGGWDPFNVTEDANLGIQSALNGYEIALIDSITYEEANSHYGNWIRQRSRWMKGYWQTLFVHIRKPLKLLQGLGCRGTISFLILFTGTLIVALLSPIWCIHLVGTITHSYHFDKLLSPITLYIGLFNMIIGNGLTIYLNVTVIWNTSDRKLLPYAFLTPVYWLLHTVAAYKAIWQLLDNPYYWEKTRHGISKYSKNS